MNGFFVRTAGAADLAGVSALLRATWHATYDDLYGVDRVREISASWHGVDELKKHLKRPRSEFLVADDGRRLGGMAFAAAGPADPHVVFLHQLYVLPELQGQGIGRDLLSEIVTSFPQADRMQLEVEKQNARAIDFYLQAGFREIGVTAHCGTTGSDIPALVLEKRLN